MSTATHFIGSVTVNNSAVRTGPDPLANTRGHVPGGRTLWVSSTASPKGDGTDQDHPKATLFGASGALAALGGRQNKGDVIYVMPGHTESVSAADMASHTGAASGFSVIGLGTGSMRPVFTWTADTASWLLDTANVEIANLMLYFANSAAGTQTTAAPITVSAPGCRLVGNYIHFGWDGTTKVTRGIVTTAAADDFEFMGNDCEAATAAACVTFLELVGVDRPKIFGNWIKGATTNAAVGIVNGATTASTQMQIAGNYLANMKNDSTIALSPLAASTGEISGNRFFVASGILPITASIGEWFNNYVINGAGEAGALVGTASAL